MKKLFFYLFILLIIMISCSKETPLPLNDKRQQEATIAATSNRVNAVPIDESANFDYYNYVWNPCSNEWIALSGTGHYELKGMISEDKITYVVHFNLSNVKGVALSSGIPYITTQTFNYSNTASFVGDHRVFQQSASIHFICSAGEGSFTIINDWHLTVNANGVETFFFTTGGDVVECQ